MDNEVAALIPELEAKHVWVMFVAAILSTEHGAQSGPHEIALKVAILVDLWVELYDASATGSTRLPDPPPPPPKK